MGGKPSNKSSDVSQADDLEQAFAAASSAMATTNNNRENTRVMEREKVEQQMLANPSPVDVRYESRVINNETYVTETQFQKGLSQTATQARAQTIKDLRNKPSTRKRAGIG